MFCSNCGKKVLEGARFCSQCGKAVGRNDVTLPSEAGESTVTVNDVRPFHEPTVAEAKNISSKWLWLAASYPIADGVLSLPLVLLIWFTFAIELPIVGITICCVFVVGILFCFFKHKDIDYLAKRGVSLPEWVSSYKLVKAFGIYVVLRGAFTKRITFTAMNDGFHGGIPWEVIDIPLMLLALLILNGPIYTFIRLRATYGPFAKAGIKAYAPLLLSVVMTVVIVVFVLLLCRVA